jgi:hypothetical protein
MPQTSDTWVNLLEVTLLDNSAFQILQLMILALLADTLELI